MQKISFENEEDLKEFLLRCECPDTVYLTHPSYYNSIIGYTNDDKFVYSYESLIESVYLDFLEDESIEDPYDMAVEFINYNIGYYGDKSPLVLDTTSDEDLDVILDCDGVTDDLMPFIDFFVGVSDDNKLYFNDTISNNQELKEILNKYKLEFSFI